jgi:hypothetical protein
VVYQRRVSLTDEGYEPPETATAELDEERTDPDDDWRALEDVLDDDDVVAALAVAVDDDEAETPGMVTALMAPKTPTPATAAKAMPVVSWLSSDSALSRARILASAVFVLSMLVRLRSASQSSL